MRLPHLVLKLELELEHGVLLGERLPPALPLEYRGQVVVTLLVILGSELKENLVNLIERRRRTLIEDNDRCLVCTGGAEDLRMFTGFARTWAAINLHSLSL